MKFSVIECFFIVMLIMVIGQIASNKNKSFCSFRICIRSFIYYRFLDNLA
ncbi:hypothetical protein [Clostridium carboxidivorans]|nr:hypothetical protein [Clostridium carboxidivorans]